MKSIYAAVIFDCRSVIKAKTMCSIAQFNLHPGKTVPDADFSFMGKEGLLMNDKEVNVRSYAQMLQDGLEEVFSSEAYRRFLTFIANNPNYSYRNVILILQQCPHATKVMGFQAWKKVGRVANQRGLRINARFGQSEDEQETTFEKLTENAKKKNSFRRISVFDISQTAIIDGDLAEENGFGETDETAETTRSGNVIPFKTDMLDGEVVGYSNFIRWVNEFTPLPISFRSCSSDGSNSYSEIIINKNMSQLHTIRTIVNQITQCWRRAYCTSKDQLAIEAESVAFIACQYLGLDTSEFSFNHIASYCVGKEQKHLEDFLDKIQKTALYFIDSIDGVRVAERIEYSTSEYFLLANLKTARRLFQSGSPVYLVYPGEGELLAMKRKELDEHTGPFATDRNVWFSTDQLAA